MIKSDRGAATAASRFFHCSLQQQNVHWVSINGTEATLNEESLDVTDVLALTSAWLTPDGDIDGNGTTDVNDMLLLLDAFG
ncbi:MAG: hypothetical protein P8M22_10920 [Phycisphaerales bacterium]|nr:hypothetical protein [Phycisphaerales bacterium]